MQFLYFGPLLFGVAWTSQAPATALEKREQPTATLNFGPISQYQQSTTAVERPKGTDLEVYPRDATSIPAAGAFVVFGPDLQKELQKRVDDDTCKDVEGKACQEAISNIIRRGQSELETRSLSPWASMFRPSRIKKGLIGLLMEQISSFLISKWKYDRPDGREPIPSQFHYPAKVLSEIGDFGDANVVVFKTADNDKDPVTATLTTSDTPSEPSSFPEGLLQIADDIADGHEKGDIEIVAPSDDAAKALNEFFKKGTCASTKQKRADTLIDCLRDSAQSILDAMRRDGPLNALARPAMQVAQDFPIPNFINVDYNTAFGQWVALAAQAIPQALPDLDEAQQRQVALTAFMLAVAHHGQKFMDRRKIFLKYKSLISDKVFDTLICPKEDSWLRPSCELKLCHGKNGRCTSDLMKPCRCGDGKTNAKCPTNLNDVPFCADCKVSNGLCTNEKYKDCRCIEVAMTNVFITDPLNWFSILSEVTASLEDFTYDPSNSEPGKGDVKPSCDKNGKRSDVPSLVFKSGTYKSFCKTIKDDINSPRKLIVDVQGREIATKRSRFKRAGPVTSDNYIGITVELRWTGSKGAKCSADCEEALSDLAGSQCGGPAMATESSVDVGCGTYSVIITKTGDSVVSKPGDQQCTDYDKSYDECFLPIDSNVIDSMPNSISAQWPDDRTVTVDMKNYSTHSLSYKNKNMLHYYMNIGWIPGCKDHEKMNMEFPQGKDGSSFDTILKDNYHLCGDNNGLGGYRDFGCLRYGTFAYVVENGKILVNDDMTPEEHDAQYWDEGGKFCVS